MISFLKPSPDAARLPAERIDPEYRRLRWRVFAGIFIGYAAYYLVRKNFALAIPDILAHYPQYSKAALGTAMTGLSIAYGVSEKRCQEPFSGKRENAPFSGGCAKKVPDTFFWLASSGTGCRMTAE